MRNIDKICEVSGCTMPVYAKGLCRVHYKRKRGREGAYKRAYSKRKSSLEYRTMKHKADAKYRVKKKLGINTSRLIPDENALVNKDWQKYSKLWVEKNNYLDKKACLARAKYNARKLECFDKYGGSICARCGNTDVRVLTMDHIDNNGAEHRKEIGTENIVSWLRRNNYPRGFQVLCRNCNWIKELERQEVDFKNRRNANN